MTEAETGGHLGYEKSERFGSDDARNGDKRKCANSGYGSVRIDMPQDRNSTFELRAAKKRQKGISDTNQKILSIYAEEMAARQV